MYLSLFPRPMAPVPPYETLLEEATIGIFMARPGEGFVWVNERACALTGYDEEEILGQSPDALRPPDRESADDIFTRLKAEEAIDVNGEIMRKDGTTIPVETRLSWAEEGYAIGFMREIADKKDVEARVERQIAALETALDGIAILDEEGRYVYVNPAHADMYGFEEPGDLIGQSWRLLYEDAQVQFLEEEVLPALQEGGWIGEVPARQADGASITTRISLTPLEAGGLVCVCRDVTEQNRRERQMELLNRTLRHDIGNAANHVIGFADLLNPEAGPKRQERYRQRIRRAGVKIAQLTDTARALMQAVNTDGIDTEPIDLTSLIEEEVRSAQRLYETPTITGPDHANALYVRGSPLLSTVVANLISNAIEHNDPLSVEVRVTVGQPGPETARMAVIDNGSGIPDPKKEGIFGEGEQGLESAGTGMGLYLAREVTTLCGGDIWVEDREPTGSRFIVELPTTAPPGDRGVGEEPGKP